MFDTVSVRLTFSAVAAALALSACGAVKDATKGVDVEYAYPTKKNDREIVYEDARGNIIGESSIRDAGGLLGALSGKNDPDAAFPVNRYLWRASLDVLSQTLPLNDVDAVSGVISTDWSTLAAPNERLRASAFVTSVELEASALDVQVYREVLGAGNVWQSAAVAPGTAEKLEDAILTRARQLRIDDLNQG